MDRRPAAEPVDPRVQALLDAYRTYGHLAADLDPLGLTPRDWSNLELERFGFAPEELEQASAGPPDTWSTLSDARLGSDAA